MRTFMQTIILKIQGYKTLFDEIKGRIKLDEGLFHTKSYMSIGQKLPQKYSIKLKKLILQPLRKFGMVIKRKKS